MPTTIFILAAVIHDEPYLKSARTLAQSRVLMIRAGRGEKRDIFGATAHSRAGRWGLCRAIADRARAQDQKLRTGADGCELDIADDAKAARPAEWPFLSRNGCLPAARHDTGLSRSFATLAVDGVSSEGRTIAIGDRERLCRFAQPSALIDDPQFVVRQT